MLRLALIRLAKQYGRYGYRNIAELLHVKGWTVIHLKVERLLRKEELQLPQRKKAQAAASAPLHSMRICRTWSSRRSWDSSSRGQNCATLSREISIASVRIYRLAKSSSLSRKLS